MKTIIYPIIFCLALALTLASCDDDNYNGIQNQGEVKLLTFTAGAKLETLDEESSLINLVYKTGTDLTKVTPSFTLSEGASIKTPANPNGPIDFSGVVTYTLINGNVYHDYKIISKHVADVTNFDQFTIGIYNGSVDNAERKIVVKMPLNTDVTALAPSYALSEGVTLVSPTETVLNFTNPVQYTISYLDESFTYEVSVELVDFRKMAFLGAPASAGDITNMDDKTAYEWFAANFPVNEYISFADIKAGKDLNDYAVIWYHYDAYDKGGDPVVHSDVNAQVTDALNAYLAQGGNMYLSSAGMALGNVLNIAKDGKMWNNAWGYDGSPFLVNDDNGIGWGLRVKDPSHPAFKNIQWNTGETHRFFLLSNGCYTKGHNIRWNFTADWDGNVYNRDVARWESTNGGRQLASLHWDDQMNEVCIMTEYERNAERGAVITMGAECYDWYNEENSPANKYRRNLETLTYNILNYLAE